MWHPVAFCNAACHRRWPAWWTHVDELSRWVVKDADTENCQCSLLFLLDVGSSWTQLEYNQICKTEWCIWTWWCHWIDDFGRNQHRRKTLHDHDDPSQYTSFYPAKSAKLPPTVLNDAQRWVSVLLHNHDWLNIPSIEDCRSMSKVDVGLGLLRDTKGPTICKGGGGGIY